LQYPMRHEKRMEDCALWCEAVGLVPHFVRRGPVFTDSNGVTEAAFAGMGMALLRRSFIAPALTQGRLVNPLAQPIACPLAYHLVYHETALLAPANRCFRDWLLGQRPAVAEEHA
ncbi:LysR substrate-binding domain-containing protein, partial [Klebsiella pneumoniae]